MCASFAAFEARFVSTQGELLQSWYNLVAALLIAVFRTTGRWNLKGSAGPPFAFVTGAPQRASNWP